MEEKLTRRAPDVFRGPFVAFVVVFLAVLGVGVGTAAAHNELTGVDPVDGSAVDRDGLIRFSFLNAVPLDTMSVEAIDQAGARTAVAGLRHGDATTEVIVAAADLPGGSVTLRWRLVGVDGHVVTDRVQYVVGDGSAAVVTTQPAIVADDDESPVAPLRRWLWRAAGYVALMLLVGVGFTERWLWPALGANAMLRRATTVGVVAVGAMALVQVVELAAQIDGVGLGAAIGRWRSALRTRAGDALAFRAMVAALALVFVTTMARYPRSVADGMRVGLLALLLGSWSFAGHAASGRWPVLGVVIDVAHHGAAALWIGGLAALAVGLRSMEGDEAGSAMARFSAVAPWLVGTLAVTGVVAKLRLLESPSALLGAHSLVLVAKLAVVAALLWIADLNRRRVRRWADDATPFGVRRVDVLRRAMATETISGALVVGSTAVLVVTSP